MVTGVAGREDEAVASLFGKASFYAERARIESKQEVCGLPDVVMVIRIGKQLKFLQLHNLSEALIVQCDACKLRQIGGACIVGVELSIG